MGACDKRREGGFLSKDPVFLRIRLDGLSLDMMIVKRGSPSRGSGGCTSSSLLFPR